MSQFSSEISELMLLRHIAMAIYVGRLKEAWGKEWRSRMKMPSTLEGWRAYPHHPIAEVDLCLASAKEVIKVITDREKLDPCRHGVEGNGDSCSLCWADEAAGKKFCHHGVEITTGWEACSLCWQQMERGP